MTTSLSEEEISTRIIAFIRERFLDGDPKGELEESSPLLEWGIINSLNTAILLAFINEEFGTPLSLERLDAQMFKSVRSIATVLAETARGARA